ncbi:hypothetical protein [Aliivibrio fischeri]|uniref:hypothetical protein n=1 Tax=Aliivibrio fischeri TaxID=668 RepID=UPI0007C4FFBA|nr:hypothetical protein [Aliivibrio fischeri]
MSKAYNLEVIKHVLQPNDFCLSKSCPTCARKATRTEYDRNDGGCINSYFRTDCGHCGHHNCNDEFCITCEVLYSQSEQYKEEQQYVKSEQFDVLLEKIKTSHKTASPVLITNVKIYMHRYLDDLTNVCDPITKFKNAITSILIQRSAA